MKVMRAALAVAALSALVLVAAGCGSGVSAVARSADLGADAAHLVPADAAAYVAADTDLGSTQWQRVDNLTKSFPIRAKLLDQIRSELRKRGLTWKDDVAPALGSEVDVAVFGTSAANAEYVAFAQPADAGKLRTLATRLSRGTDHYTVERIGGWSVVADSRELFDRVRSAQHGRSLADVAAFKSAWSSVSGDALARAYVTGGAVASAANVLPLLQQRGKTEWLAARVAADSDALRVELARHLQAAVPAAAKQTLLGDVPSGAALAVAFHGYAGLARALMSTQLTAKLPLNGIAPLLTGDGALYVRSSGLLPELALELTPRNPQAALASAHKLLSGLAGRFGALPLKAQLSGGKLVIADGPAAAAALRTGGPKLVGDADYKQALKDAGVPAKTTFVAYANVAELAPFIQLVAQAIGGKAPDPALVDNLTHVDRVLAWGSQANGVARISLWVRPR